MIPFGWIQPIVIKLKILFEEACKLKIGWDDLVPPDFNGKWQRTVSEIISLKEIMIQDVIVIVKFRIRWVFGR